MRACLLLVALMSALTLARAADTPDLKTNVVDLGMAGRLEVPTPSDWSMIYTNLGLPDNPTTIEFQAPGKSILLRFYIRWDGFGGKSIKPTEAEMGKIITGNVTVQYLRTSAEKRVILENSKGSAVSLVYARITDADWSPIMKNEYPNITEGMFRCGNIWGNFNLFTFDKDGPHFKTGLKILQSMRREP
jgi:hypothetical protein